MDFSAGIVKFRVSGAAIEAPAAEQLLSDQWGCEKKNIKLYTVQAQRSAERAVTVHAQAGCDVVVVKIAGGPPLFLHPDAARALFMSEAPAQRDRNGGDIPVSAELPWSADLPAQRGGLSTAGKIVLEWFGIMHFDMLQEAAQHTAEAIAKRYDDKVQQGLYQLQRDAFPETYAGGQQQGRPSFDSAGPGAGTGPLLILVHGAFVNAATTFGKLWSEQGAVVKQLFDAYDDRVFAFDHPTLLVSPIANALALARALPDHAVIDLVTHSRGGLVAEVLVRAAAVQCSLEEIALHFPSDAPGDGADLRALHHLLRDKKISVRRVVRVACPARGTLLASGRFDAYLSVFHWLLAQAQLVIPELLFEFLREVAREGTQPGVLPGIAAMVPDSALVKWLNAPIGQVGTSLYVLAGDSTGDTVRGWLKTLVADAFYWTDNDLIVQTRSMYGGVPRMAEATARFRRFEGADVSHFTYFSRAESARAVADALRTTPGAEWKLIGPLSLAGQDAGGLRNAAPAQPTAACVFVIPDFFGSHLATPDGRKIWLDGNSPAVFNLLDPQSEVPLKPAGLVMECYGKLCERLAETHEVVPFAYDWRLSLERTAELLARDIEQRLGQQRTQSLRFIAHGMGGLVLRVLHLNKPVLWKRMMTREGARIVMLGVPQHGTWTPLQALSGDDTFDNLLGVAGPLFGTQTVRQVLARMPGFIQLQAGLDDPAYNLKERASWEALQTTQKDALTERTAWHRQSDPWAIPDQALLDTADRLWSKLDHEAETLAEEKEKIVLVAGSAQHTPSGVTRSGKELLFACVGDGDGRVPLKSVSLPPHKLWRVKAEHGRMPMALPSFGALMELLNHGKSSLLEEHGITADNGVIRDAAVGAPCKTRRFRHAESASLPQELAALFDVRLDDVNQLQPEERLLVRVNHSDLRFIRVPLIVGHYQSLTLTGSEAVVDTLVSGRMTKALRAGIYPDRVGSYQIFDNGQPVGLRRQKQRFIPRPKAAVVVGLGEEGKLNTQQLSFTLRIGILAFAERLTERVDPVASFDIAATLVGSGGSGITTGNAALALVQAIMDANQKLEEAKWPKVTGLEIVEKYLDRATDAWRVLTAHAQANQERMVVAPVLAEGEGRMRRPLDASYRGAAYDFISAVRTESTQDRGPAIAYSLDTKRARTEVRAQHPQGQLLNDLVAKASNSPQTDPLIGRTLFNLLVPVEIEPFLAGSTDMVMELDSHTSALPWEMLHTDPDPALRQDQAEQFPWAIRSKVIRKLQTREYRNQVVDASIEDNILIVGEPKVDDRFSALPGAKREAESIAQAARNALDGAPDRVTLLANANDAHDIITQLFARNYRIVHIAGHGNQKPHGVVLSGPNTFLGRAEIEAMRITPELVFINCCHLAQRGPDAAYDRVAFAAGVADALINIGVRCVVAAGWAVQDIPAERFATNFYMALFSGARFIDAVGAGRKAAWQAAPGSNTWAAYQCYGDPDWSFRTAKAPIPSPADEYAGVASPGTLILVLQSIQIDALYTAPGAHKRHCARLAYLEKKFPDWMRQGEVCEEFGKAYAALSHRKRAIRWFEQATGAPDGSARLQTLALLAEQHSLPGAEQGELVEAIAILEAMVSQLKPTLIRRSLLGNAYKRLAAVMANGDAQARKKADHCLEKAIGYYTDASTQNAREQYYFYPPRAILECQLRRSMLNSEFPVPQNWQHEAMTAAEYLTDQAAHDDPEFFSIVAQSQMDILKALISGTLHRATQEIGRALQDLQNRIGTPRYWTYIQDDTRLLLEPYMASLKGETSLPEHKAAEELLQQLARYCKEPDQSANPS